MIFRCEDWHKGDECPICGSRIIRRIITYEDLLKSDEKMYEINIMENNVSQEKYICNDCSELLLKLPARKEKD